MSVARGRVAVVCLFFFFVAGGVGGVGVSDGYSDESGIMVFGWVFFGGYE